MNELDDQYRGNSNSLIKSVLNPKIFPSIKELWIKADTSKLINDVKQENLCAGGLNMYFCIVFYNIWREKIPAVIQILHYYDGLNCI